MKAKIGDYRIKTDDCCWIDHYTKQRNTTMIYNIIICGDTVYELNAAYLRGANAMRNEISFRDNPFGDGSYSHDQWEAGHEHEAAGEHFRFGRDVLNAIPPEGDTWREDKGVPRDSSHNVDMEWYEEQLAAPKIAKLISVRIEVPQKSRRRHGVGSYKWIDGFKVITPEGMELQPYMRKREAVSHCKERGWTTGLS